MSARDKGAYIFSISAWCLFQYWEDVSQAASTSFASLVSFRPLCQAYSAYLLIDQVVPATQDQKAILPQAQPQ